MSLTLAMGPLNSFPLMLAQFWPNQGNPQLYTISSLEFSETYGGGGRPPFWNILNWLKWDSDFTDLKILNQPFKLLPYILIF